MLTKNKYIKIILILIAAVVAFDKVVYPTQYPLENSLRLPLIFSNPFMEKDRDIGLTVIAEIQALQKKGVSFNTIKDSIKAKFRGPEFNLKERMRLGNDSNFYICAGTEYFEIIGGDVRNIDQEVFERGSRIKIIIIKGAGAKEKIRSELIRVTRALTKKLKRRPPNMREVATAMPSLAESRDPAGFLYAYFKRNNIKPDYYGIGRFSGNANIIVKRDFAFAGIRIRLPRQLYKKVMIVADKTPISKETKIDIVDIKTPENRLTLEYDRKSGILKLRYIRPSTAEVTSDITNVEEGTFLTNLDSNPVFCDFYDTVFLIPLYPGRERLKAVAEHVRDKKFGIPSDQTERRTFFHGVLYLPSFYDTYPGGVEFYRDKASEARFIVIEDIADPDNIVGYECREGGIVSLVTGRKLESDLILSKDGTDKPSYYLNRQPDFRVFDDKLDKSIAVKAVDPSEDNRVIVVGIGDGKFAFRVKVPVKIISFEGYRAHITTRRDRERYPIRIVRINDDREMRIGYKDPHVQGEFIIEGLNWEDGTPVVMKGFKGRRGKTGYFNISTILEMLNQDLLRGIEVSDLLFATLGSYHYNPDPNLRGPFRSYEIREIEGNKFLIEGDLVDPETFEPWVSSRMSISNRGAVRGNL